jgi:hypothetical protein
MTEMPTNPNSPTAYLVLSNTHKTFRVELAIGLFCGNLLKRTEGVDAGVIDENMDRAVALLDPVEGAGDVLQLREVTLDSGYLASGGSCQGLSPPCGEHQI